MKERGNMQKTINKYQSKFDRLMRSMEKDKILRKMPGNATAGRAVQMIKDLKNYLKVNKLRKRNIGKPRRLKRNRIK